MNSVLRPNYRLARELKSEMDDVRSEIETAEREGAFSRVQDLTESLHDMQHAFFMTGVTSEYEL